MQGLSRVESFGGARMIDLTISTSIAEAHAKAEHDDVARCRIDSYLHVLECIKRLVVSRESRSPSTHTSMQDWKSTLLLRM